MSDHAELLLEGILEEQRKANQLLMMLIEALSEEEEDPDAQPMRYLDGAPVASHPDLGE